jgi:hypothetical protein
VAAQDPGIGRGVAADAGVYEQSLAGAGGGDGAAVEDVDGGKRRLGPYPSLALRHRSIGIMAITLQAASWPLSDQAYQSPQ